MEALEEGRTKAGQDQTLPGLNVGSASDQCLTSSQCPFAVTPLAEILGLPQVISFPLGTKEKLAVALGWVPANGCTWKARTPCATPRPGWQQVPTPSFPTCRQGESSEHLEEDRATEGRAWVPQCYVKGHHARRGLWT